MDIIIARYKELYDRLDKSDDWLEINNYTDWDQVKLEDARTYQLRKNIEMQMDVIQKSICDNLGLIYGGKPNV